MIRVAFKLTASICWTLFRHLAVKEVRYIVASPISIAVNQTIHTGTCPDRLRIAKVIPLFKKGNNSLFENYRPISLLPSFSKNFERIFFNQLYDYFHTNNLFYNNQYGFRKMHSTEPASVELIDRIQQQLDTKADPFTIFLDFSKAFDTIDHNILLPKLSYYGIQDKALNLFKDYLSNRTQYALMDKISSTSRKIYTGVPQGSILGPILFIIYINEMHIISNKFDFVSYLDHTTLSSNILKFKFDDITNKHRSVAANINAEHVKISNWVAVNKLSLNAKKCHIMLFHHRQKTIAI